MAATAAPERATIIFQAKLAEYAERYDEMVESMKKVLLINQRLLWLY